MAVKNIDNKLLPIAKRYSDALIEVARNKNELDTVYSDLQAVSEALNSVDELKKFLAHPVIPHADKKEVLKNIFEGKINTDTLNLIYILSEKNKTNLVDTILYCFEQSMDEAKNILKVGVVSAVEIDDAKLKKSVKFDFEINPDIIAGLILKINDKTIDGSMAAKLEGFKKLLR